MSSWSPFRTILPEARPPQGALFEVAQGELPPGYTAVREEDDKTTIRMLQQMVEALVEENGQLVQELFRLQNELAKKK